MRVPAFVYGRLLWSSHDGGTELFIACVSSDHTVPGEAYLDFASPSLLPGASEMCVFPFCASNVVLMIREREKEGMHRVEKNG